MRDPMRPRACLAGTGASHHKEGLAWPRPCLFNAVLHGTALFRVQPFEMCGEHRLRIAEAVLPLNHNSCFVRNRFVLTDPCPAETPQWG
jgi:hypothetical protein